MTDNFHDPNLDRVADDIRWLGERLKGFIGAADALKNLGSINNAINEKTAIHADLAKQIEVAKAEFEDWTSKIVLLKGDHEAATAELAKVNAAHRKTVELLGGALKQVAPQG